MVVRPILFYNLKIVAMTNRQDEGLEMAVLKMLKFCFGVSRRDRIMNEHITETAQVTYLGT